MIEDHGDAAVDNPKAAEPAAKDVPSSKVAEPAGKDVSSDQAAAVAAKRAALDQLRAVVKRAQEGDRRALPQLRKALDEHPEYFEHAGDLAMMAEHAWLELMAGSNLFLRETVERKLAEMRRELTGLNPSPL